MSCPTVSVSPCLGLKNRKRPSRTKEKKIQWSISERPKLEGLGLAEIASRDSFRANLTPLTTL